MAYMRRTVEPSRFPSTEEDLSWKLRRAKLPHPNRDLEENNTNIQVSLSRTRSELQWQAWQKQTITDVCDNIANFTGKPITAVDLPDLFVGGVSSLVYGGWDF